MEKYWVIKYAPIVRYAFLLAFLIPMFRYQLYKPAIMGSCSIAIGSILNSIVMSQNGGKMPVYPTFSYITGYVKAEQHLVANDIHVFGTAQTNCKFLTDYIDVGFCVLSIGDLFIHFYVFLMVFNLIISINKEKNQCS
jgi:hypothetical protein